MVTSKVPDVIVYAPAIPNTELVVSCNVVPLMVTLYKFAVPLKELVLVKVVVPAEAVKLPVDTANTDDIVRLVAVVMLPVTVRLNKLIEPVAVIVLEVPLMVTLPPLVVKLPPPPAAKFPVTARTDEDVIEPFSVRSLNVKLVPEIVLLVPVIVNPPPELWVKDPTPDVERFPATEIFTAPAVIFEPEKVRLLNASVPEPLIVLLAPVIVTVLVETV